MEFRIESTILEENVILKTFNKDFRAENIIDETILLDGPGINGTIRHIQLDGFCLIIKDLYISNGYTLNISGNSPLFKLHIEVEGGYKYIPANESAPMVIPGGQFNLIYFSETEGTLESQPPSQKTMEVFFTRDFLIKAGGEDFSETFSDLSNNLKSKKSFLLWNESRPIPLELQQYISDIIECRYCSHIKKIYLEARITALLLSFLADNSTKTTLYKEKELSRNDRAAIKRVEAYIREHFKRGITIAELAPVAGLNTSKLKQSFKKVHSTTIFKFITGLRMEKAKKLISNENLSVSEAAYEVGYKNPQHFTVAFKKYYGYLPSTVSHIN